MSLIVCVSVCLHVFTDFCLPGHRTQTPSHPPHHSKVSRPLEGSGVSACVCLPACLSVCLHVFGDFCLNSELRHPLTHIITERSAGALGSLCLCVSVCLSVSTDLCLPGHRAQTPPHGPHHRKVSRPLGGGVCVCEHVCLSACIY